MSEDLIPTWGKLLKQRVAALEQRCNELESAQDGPAPVPNAAVEERPQGESEIDVAETQRRKDLDELEHEIQSVQTRLDTARREVDTAEQRKIALEANAASVQAESDKLALTRRVIERIWPPFMLTPAFADWRSGIESALMQDPPPSSAALLFANLHGYTACLLEADQKYLRDVLRDISRFFYAWVKETGRDEHAAFEVAEAWAAAFNEECAGRCEIEVPEPGTPANSLSMTFPPRGSSPEVASVRTWCVRDAQKRVIHRAEVFT